jgi:hypothetical protein
MFGDNLCHRNIAVYAYAQHSILVPSQRKLSMNESSLVNLAELSLTANNLNQAEERYSRLIELTGNPIYWFNLCYVKLAMFSCKTATIGEVVFCLNLARAELHEKANTFEDIITNKLFDITMSLWSRLVSALEFKNSSNKKLLKSALFTGLAYVVRPRNDIGIFKTLSNFQIGVGVASTGLAIANAAQAECVISECEASLKQISDSLPSLINSSNPECYNIKMAFYQLECKCTESINTGLSPIFKKPSNSDSDNLTTFEIK